MVSWTEETQGERKEEGGETIHGGNVGVHSPSAIQQRDRLPCVIIEVVGVTT